MQKNNLEINLSHIAKYNNDLAQRIKKHENLSGIFELKEALSGDHLLVKNGISIHDEIDPEQEAIDILKSLKNKKPTTINVVFGIGIGYLFKRIVKSTKGKTILYEPDLDFLRLAFELVDFSQELSKENIVIVTNYDEMQKAYEKLFILNYEVNFSYLDYHKYHCTQSWNLAVKEVSDIHSIYQSNYNTYRKKAAPWAGSSLESVFYSSSHHDLSILKNKFKGKTAVIISAGPSLLKNIHLVREHRSKFCVFCVGTALKTVFNNGIKPDFAVQLERVKQAHDQLKDFDLSDVNLILQPMTHIGVHKIKAKNKFYYYASNDNTSKWLANLWGIDCSIYQNLGTVSLVALISAKILGFEKLIVIGQDLAFTGGKCYAKDSIYDDYKVKINVANPEKSDFESNQEDCDEKTMLALKDRHQKLIPVKGQIEKVVYAPSDYALFIKYFEKIAKEWEGQIQLINSTEGGAYTEGFEHIPLKEAIEKYALESVDINSTISALPNLNPKVVKKRQKLILNELRAINNITDKLIDKFYGKYMNLHDDDFKFALKDVIYARRDFKDVSIEEKYMEQTYFFLKERFEDSVNIIKSNRLIHEIYLMGIKSAEDAFRLFEENDKHTYLNLITCLTDYYLILVDYTYCIKTRVQSSINQLIGT